MKKYLNKEEDLSRNKKIIWPEGKLFAFSIFDDTDWSTVENVGPVYSFLKDNDILTTKSVWPFRGDQQPYIGGDTCDNPEYLEWVKRLQKEGFEIGFHNATFHTSAREQILTSLKKFHREIGHWPRSMANHAGCLDGIYWGDSRVSGLNRLIYNVLSRGKGKKRYRGHVEGEPLFWGDYCKKYIMYVRNFVLGDINTLKQCYFMPYHDPSKPYVNFWFASSEGANVNSFNKMVSETNQDSLEGEGGACIMYTHFSSGFYRDGHLNKRFETLMKRLARKKGWFVPVSTLLDYLRQKNGDHVITTRQRRTLERKWLLHKIRVGTT
jgi:hypothetical protein